MVSVNGSYERAGNGTIGDWYKLLLQFSVNLWTNKSLKFIGTARKVFHTCMHCLLYL